MARVELQPAYVLHRRAYRESSLLLEALTPGFGRLGLVARGGRRPGSRLRGMLEPFRPLLLSWSGRGELLTLTAAEAARPVPTLAPAMLAGGFYLNELLVRLLPRNDPHPALFESYAIALGALSGEPLGLDSVQEPVLRVFEKRLLDALGYGLVLDHDVVSGAPLNPDVSYTYRLDSGPSTEHPGVQQDVPVRGDTLRALAAERLQSPAQLREAKRLLRRVLALHLGERPVRSRALLTTAARAAGRGRAPEG